MKISKNIYILSKKLDVIIDYTHGSNLPSIELRVMDCELPEDVAVIAYCSGQNKRIKKRVCKVNGNVISFTPAKTFFELGENGLQIRITKDEKDLFSFMCLVRCHDTYPVSDAEDIEDDDPTLLAQLLTQMGDIDEKKVDEEEMLEKISEC